ncbi:hypothetical protein IQ07DRAFT_463725, partial [Pyrenochaeta sp. DS3sAY3a]
MVGIGENLDGALRSLQHKTEPRMIWVDFVCINQDDHAERKQQVELMYRLYAKAEKVVAYLGDEADGSENVPAILEHIGSAFTQSINEFGESQGEKFIRPPWFIRVWIMQEALAAKQLV